MPTFWTAASAIAAPHPICWRNSKGASRSPLATAGAAAQVPTGSPFLEGQTLTVAGAALLQRVADAVTKVGGNVLSSQVDVQGVQAKDGFVSVLASCEIDHAALQRLLYDLEAGMPFLFIEQFVAQSPQTASPQERAGACGCCSPCRAAGEAMTNEVRLASLCSDSPPRCWSARTARGANPPGALDLPPNNVMPAPVDMSPERSTHRTAAAIRAAIRSGRSRSPR